MSVTHATETLLNCAADVFSLKAIDPSMVVLPAQASSCQLAGVVKPQEGWPTELAATLANEVQNAVSYASLLVSFTYLLV